MTKRGYQQWLFQYLSRIAVSEKIGFIMEPDGNLRYRFTDATGTGIRECFPQNPGASPGILTSSLFLTKPPFVSETREAGAKWKFCDKLLP